MNKLHNNDKHSLRKLSSLDIEELLQEIAPFKLPFSDWNPFIEFSYTRTEISSKNGNACVKSKQTRFENGKLVSEEFSGTLDRQFYDRMVEDAQDNFINQCLAISKTFSFFLPFGAGRNHQK